MRYERAAGINAMRTAPQVLSGSLDADILAMTGLTGWWDYDPSRVTAGTDISLANRVPAGSPSVEHASHSTLTLTNLYLPNGGQIRQAGVYDGTTVVTMGGSFPTSADAVWTKVILFIAGAGNNGGPVTPPTAGYLWRSAGANSHFLLVTAGLLYHQLGTAGTYVTAPAIRYPIFSWSWAIATWNNTTKVANLQCNDSAVETVTGTTQNVSQAAAGFGGIGGSPGFKGRLGPALLFSGTTDADGNLFNAARAADLAKVKLWANAACGRLNLLA